jgi:hypothetical protein
MSYSGKIERIIYKAYDLGLRDEVFKKFDELTYNKRVFDLTEAYEQAYNLVIDEYTKHQSIIRSNPS